MFALIGGLGGPESTLPWQIQSAFACVLCARSLTVTIYHWYRSTLAAKALTLITKLLKSNFDFDFTFNYFDNNYYLPLVSSSKNEQYSQSQIKRHDQLIKVLQYLCKLEKFGVSDWKDLPDSVLIQIFRTDDICRRLASLMMRPSIELLKYGKKRTVSILTDQPDLDLPKRLARLWPKLLELPSIGRYDSSALLYNSRDIFPFAISVIIPAFRENGTELSSKLDRLFQGCLHPHEVEIIVTDAGGCTDMSKAYEEHFIIPYTEPLTIRTSEAKWGRAVYAKFDEGGGRGPCLNFGASIANGQLLCFLHADTILPQDWDNKLVQTLRNVDHNGRYPNSCAFSFGIDTSPKGLKGGTYPPGIKAVEFTANLRSRLFSLPYGDQCICIAHTIFRFLGGFPDQCLMEDYVLVSLLRQRAALMHERNPQGDSLERLKIITGEPALCSPRRWQQFGVLRVTYLNSKYVNLYAAGMSADELFCKYYGSLPPHRESQQSPWEIKLSRIINEKS